MRNGGRELRGGPPATLARRFSFVHAADTAHGQRQLNAIATTPKRMALDATSRWRR